MSEPTASAVAIPEEPSHAQALWASPPRELVPLVVGTIGAGLTLEATLGWPGQVAADVVTAGAFAWLLTRGGPLERRALVWGLVVGALGEVFLSLVWGVYDYRLRNIPMFVPPGHALLMSLAVVTARKVPERLAPLVPVLAIAWTGAAFLAGVESFGLLLALAFGAFSLLKSRHLYATAFILALVLELVGTAAGTWTWRPVAPVLGLAATNPPVSAGVFYCVLDILVLAALGLSRRRQKAPVGRD